MRPFLWFLSLSFLLSTTLAQTSRDDNSTLVEDIESVDRKHGPLKITAVKAMKSNQVPRSQTCGNPTETSVCHFLGSQTELCDVCAGISCPHNQKCKKQTDICLPECVCERAWESPDESGFCHGFCHPNPCQHNGTCSQSGHSFKCECQAGYSGEKCENIHNVCLDPQPHLCPTGNYECILKGVNSYSCGCAHGYWMNQDNHCVKVGHKVKLEIHFIEQPFSEAYNKPGTQEYKLAREYIKAPFELMFGDRLVSVEFHNFTQGSLIANVDIYLKAAENGSQTADELTFREHLVRCSFAQSSISTDCFGTLGRVFLPMNAWEMQDERCYNVACPEGTRCEPIDGEEEETRCVCDSGYEGYGSTVDTQGGIVELCRDVNECEVENKCASGQTCRNRNGGFECTTPCDNVKCPGYAECVPMQQGLECRCSWIYAGSNCAFPWTLIFLATTGIFFLSTVIAFFLLLRFGVSLTGSSKGKYDVFNVSSRLTAVRPSSASLR